MKIARFLLLVSLLGAAPRPARIVSTAPSVTETLFAIGAGPQVAGVSTYCRHPAAVRQLPRIGTYLQPNTERILALRPDLVLTETAPNVRPLAALADRTIALRFWTIAEILQSIRAIGTAAGHQEEGAALARDLASQLAAVRQQSARRQPVKVAFLVGRTPGTTNGLVAAGSGTYLDELINTAGGRNLFAGAGLYPSVGLEQLLAKQPDVILEMTDMAEEASRRAEQERSVRQAWAPQARTIQAVRNGKLHVVSADDFAVPGPRLGAMARKLAELLH